MCEKGLLVLFPFWSVCCSFGSSLCAVLVHAGPVPGLSGWFSSVFFCGPFSFVPVFWSSFSLLVVCGFLFFLGGVFGFLVSWFLVTWFLVSWFLGLFGFLVCGSLGLLVSLVYGLCGPFSFIRLYSFNQNI